MIPRLHYWPAPLQALAFKQVHNIWHQQSSNKGTCIFATMYDNYVQTFMQSSLYYVFLQEGASGTNPNKNGLHLHRAN